MGATINDVARLAGVSASTVSRVLSDHPRISDETKERVERPLRSCSIIPMP
jgi:DNA-binding LacI/PurR family transcriptional regulator